MAAPSKTTKTGADSTATPTTQTEEVDAPNTDVSSPLVEPSAEAPMSAADAPAVSAAAPASTNRVPITLAHPIDKDEHMRRLRLDVKEGGYAVHEVVMVTKDDARALINAGLAQIDPEDKNAVRAALRGESNA